MTCKKSPACVFHSNCHCLSVTVIFRVVKIHISVDPENTL